MSTVKFLYLHDRYGKKHGVVAYDVKGKGVGSVSYNLSLCNDKDSFDKEAGKELAFQRVNSSPNLLSVPRDPHNVQIVQAVLKKIVRTSTMPTKARKLARAALKKYH
jgi:hypothetical protein